MDWACCCNQGMFVFLTLFSQHVCFENFTIEAQITITLQILCCLMQVQYPSNLEFTQSDMTRWDVRPQFGIFCDLSSFESCSNWSVQLSDSVDPVCDLKALEIHVCIQLFWVECSEQIWTITMSLPQIILLDGLKLDLEESGIWLAKLKWTNTRL
jgi:hypothetical protein